METSITKETNKQKSPIASVLGHYVSVNSQHLIVSTVKALVCRAFTSAPKKTRKMLVSLLQLIKLMFCNLLSFT